jgi:hypothetical protein
MKRVTEEESREPAITIKSGELKLTKQDWRGLIALTIVGGLIISVIWGSTDGIITFGPLSGVVVRDYFESKKEK